MARILRFSGAGGWKIFAVHKNEAKIAAKWT
jgi:hypothetical protein